MLQNLLELFKLANPKLFMLHFPCISQGNKGCDLYIPFAPFYLLINHCLLLVVLYGITRPLPSGNVSDKISFQQYSSLSVITPSTLLSTNKMVISSVQFSCSVMSDSLRPHGLQHTRPPCPSLFQVLKDDIVKVLYSICQQTWKTQR